MKKKGETETSDFSFQAAFKIGIKLKGEWEAKLVVRLLATAAL